MIYKYDLRSTLIPVERLEKVMRRTTCLGYLEESFPTVSELANTADAKLIPSILHNPKHVLYQLLPSLRPHSTHQLRPRVHNHILPPKDDSQFIQRSLFTDLFCYSRKLLFYHLLALLRFCQSVFLSHFKRIYNYTVIDAVVI